LRADTTAISEPENTPLAIVNKKISNNSKATEDMLGRSYFKKTIVVDRHQQYFNYSRPASLLRQWTMGMDQSVLYSQ
jgi:hypothetical protein